MLKIHDEIIQKNIRFFGRTIADDKTGSIFFNWTGSGFEVVFEGRKLEAHMRAIETVFPPEGILWPWICVFIDDSEAPAYEIAVDGRERRITLFTSETCQKHKIKVVKRSENDKGKAGIAGFELDGEILPPEPAKKKYLLEFVGDSITCGFGNEAKNRDDLFITKEENGLSAYSAIAAKELGAEYNSICVSGMPLCKPRNRQFRFEVPRYNDLYIGSRAMEDYYEYTDRLHEEMRGKKSDFTRWDFSRFRPDAIVINLGTNDSYIMKVSKDTKGEERNFEQKYKEFIYKVRELNGPRPLICCTLGPMDYYNYNNIQRAVTEYKKETDDKRVICHKFGGIFPELEGYGAQGHPSALTHQRMGKELSERLKEFLNDDYLNERNEG